MAISNQLHDLLLSALGSPESRDEIEAIINEELTSTPLNTASAVVQRDASGNFAAGTITADLTGTASNVANSAVIAKVLTGFVSSAAPVAAANSILTAFNSVAGTAESAYNGSFGISGVNAEVSTSGAISVSKFLTTINTAGAESRTLAAPGGAGILKVIQANTMVGACTLAMTNIIGGRAANGDAASTTVTFTNSTDSLILMSVAGKWVYLGGSAVCT